MQLEGLKILAFDETAAASVLLRTAIEQCAPGLQLTLCKSHEEVKERIAAERFDLFLTNFGTDSCEMSTFLKGIRERDPHLRIAVFSGMPDPSKAYEAGAHIFVGKSSNWDVFTARIKGLLRFCSGVTVR